MLVIPGIIKRVILKLIKNKKIVITNIKNNDEKAFSKLNTTPEKASSFSVIIDTIELIFFFFISERLLCKLFL